MGNPVNWGSQLGVFDGSQLGSQLIQGHWPGAYGCGPMVGQLASQQEVPDRLLTAAPYKGQSTGQPGGGIKALDPPAAPRLNVLRKGAWASTVVVVALLHSIKDLCTLAKVQGPRPVTICSAGVDLLFTV